MNSEMLRVTNRIIERSRDTREAYLARINQAKTDTVHRAQLACGNLAHGFAACQADDKASLKSMLRNNIAIITSYLLQRGAPTQCRRNATAHAAANAAATRPAAPGWPNAHWPRSRWQPIAHYATRARIAGIRNRIRTRLVAYAVRNCWPER